MSYGALNAAHSTSPPPNPIPPPPYAAISTIPMPTQGPLYVPTPIPSPGGSPYFEVPHHHHSFGPTPLSAQPVTSYAYYDPRSPYSIAQAGARARRRFVEALFGAAVIWCLIGFLVGSGVVEITRRLQ